MAGIKGISYQKYHARQEALERRKERNRRISSWLLVLIRIVILPLTLLIRLYRWVYYD